MPAAVAASAAATLRTPERQIMHDRARPRARPRPAGSTKSVLSRRWGPCCHSRKTTCLPSSAEVGHADLVPLLLRADVDEDRVRVVADEVERLGGGQVPGVRHEPKPSTRGSTRAWATTTCSAVVGDGRVAVQLVAVGERLR